jgi:hypothetical protein
MLPSIVSLIAYRPDWRTSLQISARPSCGCVRRKTRLGSARRGVISAPASSSSLRAYTARMTIGRPSNGGSTRPWGWTRPRRKCTRRSSANRLQRSGPQWMACDTPVAVRDVHLVIGSIHRLADFSRLGQFPAATSCPSLARLRSRPAQSLQAVAQQVLTASLPRPGDPACGRRKALLDYLSILVDLFLPPQVPAHPRLRATHSTPDVGRAADFSAEGLDMFVIVIDNTR